MPNSDNQDELQGFRGQPSGSKKDIEASQFAKMMKGLKQGDTTASTSEETNGSRKSNRPQQNQKPKNFDQKFIPRNHDNGTGGNSGGGNGGNGRGGNGSGGSGGSGWSFGSKGGSSRYGIIALVVIVGVLIFMLLHKNDTDRISLERVTVETTQPKVVSAPVQAPLPYIESRNINQQNFILVPAPVQNQPKTVAYTEPFDCPPKEVQGEERTRIFDAHKVSTTEAGQVLHVASRCSVVRIKEPVTELQGSDYVFAIPAPHAPGNFWKCGTFGGFHNTLTECKNMLNRHPGLDVRFAVGEGEVVLK